MNYKNEQPECKQSQHFLIKDKRRSLINNVCKFSNCKNKRYVILTIYVLMIYKIHGIHASTDYYLLTIKLLKKLEIKFAITWFDITGITLLIFQQAKPQIGLPAVN